MLQLPALLPWMGYCRQLRPALDRYVRLALWSWWESRPEGPDVPRDGCGPYVWWGHRLVTFRSSRFRIFGCTGGGGLRLSVGQSLVRDQSLSCLVSPPGSVSKPIPSQISPSLRPDDVARPPMDQYLPVSLDLSGIGPLSDLPTVVSTSAVVPPWENGLTISGGGLGWISYSGAWGCSTRGLRDRHRGRAAVEDVH